MTFGRPRESESYIYTEKKLGDESLALWQSGDLPDGAAVTRVTLIPYRGERPVVAWRSGNFRLPEGDVKPGESTEDAVRRVGLEQTGINTEEIVALGHFRCRATSLSKTQAPGSITYQALYGVEVESVTDFPADTAYERRIIRQRDLNELLRGSYVEVRREYTDALDVWLLRRLKANLA